MSFIKDAVEEVIFPSPDLLSDEPQMESYLHLQQMILLIKCLEWLWRDRNDFFAAGNLTIYYSPRQRKSEDFRGPDFFVVLRVERKPRNSWVVWAEDGKYPHVIVELLSSETAEIDRGLKKQIYQSTFRTPDYFWFDTAYLRDCFFFTPHIPASPNKANGIIAEDSGTCAAVTSERLLNS